MFISVLIPTYNRNDLLVNCLNCLSPQVQAVEANNYEVIVSDDSKDNIAKEFLALHYPWVKWVEGPKKGPASNRNNAAKHAKGDWLIFTDDDCLPDSNWLSTYMTSIVEFKDIMVFEGKTIADRPQQRFDEEAPINLNGGNLWSCNFAIKKEIFEQLNGFDETFPFAAMEDTDFYTRVLGAKLEVKFLSNALIIHPWRRIQFLKTSNKHIKSHRHFTIKYQGSISLQYRISRLKIAISKFFPDLLRLLSFKGKGVLYFIEKTYLNIRLIFI